MLPLPELVRLSLAEDIGPGDVTTQAVVPEPIHGFAWISAKQGLVVCGQEVVTEVFRQVGIRYQALVPDGVWVEPATRLGEATGDLARLLLAERTALNFLMRLSGIASHTRSVVARAGELKVVDTRKTTPLHRALEKYAVRCGGGHNHRFALYDGVLVKDNHIVAAGGVAEAVRRARSVAHHLLRIEVEVETLAQLHEAIEAGADAVLLDNMDDDLLREAVRVAGGRVLLEASGNMTADRVAALADSGLDFVSMGGLIHQARWADVSMRLERA